MFETRQYAYVLMITLSGSLGLDIFIFAWFIINISTANRPHLS